MDLTPEQLQMASRIDAKAQKLIAAGQDDLTIVAGMLEHLPDFKRLLGAGQGVMDELCRRFFWFFRYAKALNGWPPASTTSKAASAAAGAAGAGLPLIFTATNCTPVSG
jgi:hypothetical protein